MNELCCYALRRINPFLGVTQVVETAAARALSVDGVNWELQLQAVVPVGWGYLNRGQVATSYCRYAVWSAADGLTCSPLPPQFVRSEADAAVAGLIEAVAAALPRLPFALADSIEGWLIDVQNRKPLALLGSRLVNAPLPERSRRRWFAAQSDAPGAMSTDFASLETVVSKLALAEVVWIKRADDGSGCAIDAHGQPLAQRFDAADFPELLLELPPGRADEEIVRLENYRAWLAPRLLMLPLLPATRARLEVAAARQPTEVAHFFRLYPAVADPALLNALRVQAQLIACA